MQHENLVGDFPTFPKQLRSKQKREALIESAKLLFNEKGFEHTTAKEIAAHAKVATGTFYRYFSDKRQLLMTLIDNQIDSMMPLDLEWKSGDPEKLLAGRLEMHYHKINEKNLRKLMPELLLKDAELAEVVNEAKMRMQGKVLGHLQTLQKKRADVAGHRHRDVDLVLAVDDGKAAKPKERRRLRGLQGICQSILPDLVSAGHY
ncbi:TetR/AcrR family transcriptional regulator [Planococcus glaciei]|nr:TetR/AcrR family transcriptional regulator [Planococcus glaciei]QDY46227.1 TetR/AcrR family transcriptional regulator [Planococcus glaciei]